MSEDTLTCEYFSWVLEQINTEKNKNTSIYSKLLEYLYSKDFLTFLCIPFYLHNNIRHLSIPRNY